MPRTPSPPGAGRRVVLPRVWSRVTARTSIVLGIALSASLVAQSPASAYSAGGLAANPWIISDFAAMEGSTLLAGGGTAVGSSAVTGAAAASAGAVTTSAGAGLAAVGAVGTLVASLGAAIGLGHLPGLKGVFGSSGGPALPAGGGATGTTTYAGCPGQTFTSGTLTAGTRSITITYTGCTGGAGGPGTGTATYTLTTTGIDGWQLATETSNPYNSATFNSPWNPAQCSNGFNGGGPYTNLSMSQGPNNGYYSRRFILFAPPATYAGYCSGGNEAYTPVRTTAAGASVGFSSAAAPANDNNPLRWIESKGNCTHPDGTVTVVTTSSSTFTRAVGATGAQTTPAAPEVICPVGRMLTGATSEIVTTGTTTRVPVMAPYVADATLVSKLASTAAGNYSSCLTTLCALHVQRLSPDLDCSTIAPGAGHPCRDWSLDSGAATKYECRYGANVLSLTTCASLKKAYGANPVLTPNSGTTPDTVVVPDVNEDTTSGLTPGLNDDGCVPSGLGILNPFWLVKGMGCVLKWAFVPKTGTFQTAQATISGGWANNGFTAWGAAVGGVGGSVAGMGAAAGSSCEGPEYVLPLGGHDYPFKPLSACTQPMQGVAVVIKLLGTVIVIIAGVKLCARPIMAAFGMGQAV